jgi:putative oxygen-independent coproporphyrinogen III oxidase
VLHQYLTQDEPQAAAAHHAPDDAPGFGVYVHWPFCASKCPYCDFNSHVSHKPVDEARFAVALGRELEHHAQQTPGRRVASVFFGGGTPSLMAPQTIESVLSAIEGLWPLAPDAEITLEANPSSVEAARFSGYRAAGVNRVSLGVQSLRDDQLRFLGRLHSADEARRALSIATRTFEHVSIDLIYARPGQTEAEWREELHEALALGTRHLSAYQLTIEPDTAFFRLHQEGRLRLPSDDAAADLYALTSQLCAEAGLSPYETSNYARPGEESRHNLVYWRYGEYAGVGPGAHSRLRIGESGRAACEAIRDPAGWLMQVERDGTGIASQTAISRLEQAEEMLLMGLRLSEGLPLARLASAGYTISPEAIADLARSGLVEMTDDARIRVREAGRLLVNHIVLRLAQALCPLEVATG